MNLNINYVLLTVLVAICFVNIVNAEKRLRFKVKNITAWSDNTFLNFSYNIDEKTPSADVIWKVLTPIDNLDYNIQANVVTKNNKNHYAAVNVSYNLCQLFSFVNTSPIGMLVYAHIKSYGHLADSCPIKKDTYTLKKIWPEDHSAQVKLPELEFDLNIKAYAIQNAKPTLIMDVFLAAESVYMEVTGEVKRTGLLSLLNSGR